MFKSTVEKLYDFRNVTIPEEMRNIEVDESEALEELERYAKKHATLTDVDDCVQLRDTVNVTMKSALPKYNKENVPISVGAGFFGKDFENGLLGMKKGDKKTLDADGTPVETSILNIKRNVLHEINDELIKKQNIEGISTVEEFKDFCRKKATHAVKSSMIWKIFDYIVAEVIEKSVLSIDDDDLEILINMDLETEFANIRNRVNIDPRDMTRQQLFETTGKSTIEEMRETARERSKVMLQRMLISRPIVQSLGIVFDEATYEKRIEEQSAKHGIRTEQMKTDYPYAKYLVLSYFNCFVSIFRDYYKTVNFD